MGADPKDLEKEPEGVIENEDGTLSVAVDEPEAVVAEEKEEPVVEKKTEPDEEERKRNAAWAAMRVELKRKDAELAELKKQNTAPKPPEKTPEDWESELSKKPVSTIEQMIDQRVQRAVEDYRVAQSQYVQYEKVLEGSKSEAIEKHPELADANSVKSQVMMEVLSNNPDLTSNPYGPILAMHKMEKILKERGLDKPTAVSNVKIPVSSLPAGRNIPRTKTITLTREQLEMCKENNIDPKLYAKSLSSMGSSGVEV
jgi:hypothetical protein